MRDELTGLADADLLLDRLESALVRARRHGSGLAVLAILPVAAGDDDPGAGRLPALARSLEGALRDGDTLARPREQELVAVCEDLVADARVLAIARRALEAATAEAPQASIGVAIAGVSGEEADELLARARRAARRAQVRGGGVFELEPQLQERLQDRLELERDLCGAADRGELRLYYQPTYALEDGTITSLEALLRWEHPRRGTLAPPDFIDAAEETGLIVDLGRWAIEEACRQVAAWHRNLEGAELFVSVNLSAIQLERSDPLETVAGAARETGAPLERITVEIDADDLSLLEPPLMQKLRVLAAVGAGIVVDGLGDGDLPMARMEELPLRGVRLSPTVVAGLPDNPRSTALAGAALAAARALRTDTIAVGVETPGQISALRDLGSTHAAGFLLAVPMPPDRVGDVLRGKVRPAPPG